MRICPGRAPMIPATPVAWAVEVPHDGPGVGPLDAHERVGGVGDAAALHDPDLDARAVEGVGGREVRADDLARQVRLRATPLEVTVDRVDPLVPRQPADEPAGTVAHTSGLEVDAVASLSN